MAYSITNAPADTDAIIAALATFASAQGWTINQNNTTTKELSINSTGGCYVTFKYNDPTTTTKSIKMAHALGYTGGNSYWNHPDDCGQVSTSETTTGYAQSPGLYKIGNGPYISVRFFGTGSYIYMVVETTSGVYVPLWFGELDKLGDWVGGEFAGGLYRPSALAFESSSLCMPFDGLYSSTSSPYNWVTSLHIESFPNQPSGGKWGKVGEWTSALPTILGLDRAGVQRCQLSGSVRSGRAGNAPIFITRANRVTNRTQLMPVMVFYRDYSDPNDFYPLGYVPDVYQLDIGNFAPGDEVTIGSDTYQILPMHSLTDYGTTSSLVNSRVAGFAYKK